MNFGDKITITKRYKRKIIDDMLIWEPVPYKAEGIFLGTRNLTNGYKDLMEVYQVTKRFKAMLISPSPTVNPIYVPLQD